MRRLLVIAASLVVFFVPNVVGFGIWFLGGELPTVARSLAAIFGWVVSFGGSTVLFWMISVRLSPPDARLGPS